MPISAPVEADALGTLLNPLTAERLDERIGHVEQIADHAVVAHPQKRRRGIFVHRNHHLRAPDAHGVLHLPRNANPTYSFGATCTPDRPI